MIRKIKIAVGLLKRFLLSVILCKNIIIFVQKKGPAVFEVEIIDSKDRIKLIKIKLQKITNIRYQVLDRQFF